MVIKAFFCRVCVPQNGGVAARSLAAPTWQMPRSRPFGPDPSVALTKQVAACPVASRAIRFIAAGGDIVLTVNVTQAHTMATAVLARMRTDPAFKKQVYAAALVVLKAKQARGLLA